MNDDYRGIAKLYDLLFSAALKQLREDIRTYIFHKNYQRIVDICCGTGEQLHYLFRPDMKLCGIDSSLAMLEQARKRCARPIEFHLLDAEQEAFSPNSFDCAILSLALHEKHPAAAQTIFRNCYRLLKDRGALVIADFNTPSRGVLGTLIGRCLIPLIERCGGTDHYRYYSQWSETGGLEAFLNRQNLAAEIISRPLRGNLLCCAVVKDDARKIVQQNFALLDLDLRKNKQVKSAERHEQHR